MTRWQGIFSSKETHGLKAFFSGKGRSLTLNLSSINTASLRYPFISWIMASYSTLSAR